MLKGVINPIPSTAGVTSNYVLTWNGTNLVWAAGGGNLSIASKTANYDATDNDYLIRGDATSGSFSVTLPSASGRTGKVFIIKKLDSGPNTVTIVGTIDGLSSVVLNTQYAVSMVVSNGTTWDAIL